MTPMGVIAVEDRASLAEMYAAHKIRFVFGKSQIFAFNHRSLEVRERGGRSLWWFVVRRRSFPRAKHSPLFLRPLVGLPQHHGSLVLCHPRQSHLFVVTEAAAALVGHGSEDRWLEISIVTERVLPLLGTCERFTFGVGAVPKSST